MALPAPSNVRLVSTVLPDREPTALNVTWDSVNGADGYDVNWWHDTSTQTARVLKAPFRLTGLKSNRGYFVRVRAIDPEGSASDYSAVLSACTALNPPAAPTVLGSGMTGETGIGLAWAMDLSAIDTTFPVTISVGRELPDGSVIALASGKAAADHFVDLGAVGRVVYRLQLSSAHPAAPNEMNVSFWGAAAEAWKVDFGGSQPVTGGVGLPHEGLLHRLRHRGNE